MKRFEFSLDRVLNFRRTQAEMERRKLESLGIERATLVRQIADLMRQRHESHNREDLAPGTAIIPQQLAARETFHGFLSREKSKLQGLLNNLEAAITRQRQHFMEARRKCELLEKLRGKRLEEWTAEMQRELEELASDAFRARSAAEIRRSYREAS
ncbi:MAG: flagellar FliJ family protein [Acidobacteria bacterium]|nr:flagellar FliJ family protein [Acidobacteriota bacterium]